MAGAGKSSIGKKLANYLKFELIDSDQLIEANQNKSLQEILVENGTPVEFGQVLMRVKQS